MVDCGPAAPGTQPEPVGLSPKCGPSCCLCKRISCAVQSRPDPTHDCCFHVPHFWHQREQDAPWCSPLHSCV